MANNSIKPGLELKVREDANEVDITIRKASSGNFVIGILSSLQSDGILRVNYDLSEVKEEMELFYLIPKLKGISIVLGMNETYRCTIKGKIVDRFDIRYFDDEHYGKKKRVAS